MKTQTEIEQEFFSKFGPNGELATNADWNEYHNAVMPSAAFPGAQKAKDRPTGWVGPEYVNHCRS